MKSNMKIDEIYRLKFKNVETTPPEEVWESIVIHLPEKKERKVTPFWFRLASTAAVLSSIILLFSDLYFVTSTTQFPAPIAIEKQREFFSPELFFHDSNLYMKEAESILQNLRTKQKNDLSYSEIENIPTILPKPSKFSSTENENNILTQVDLSFNKKNQNSIRINSPLNKISKSLLIHYPFIKSKLEINGEKLIANFNSQTHIQTLDNYNERTEKKLFKKVPVEKRFGLASRIGIVNLSKPNNVNLLSTGLNGYEDNQKVTFSYGVQMLYRLTENLNIRSGLSKVSFSYSTKNIEYLSVINSQSVTAPLTISNGGIEMLVPGSLDQNFGLWEIPVEIEYSLLKRIIDLNIIGGASSYFLNDNNVSYSDGSNRVNLGAGTNLKSQSFSANFGVGLNYNLSNKFQLNIEPLFKYQIKTFDHSLNANSFYWGIYTGLRFNF